MARKFDDAFSSGKRGEVSKRRTTRQESGEIPASEAPFEGTRDGVVMVLEFQDVVGHSGLGREVRWGERFPLENGKVDLDLIQPAGVHRQVHQDEGGPARLKRDNGPLPAMDGPVVDYPEHARSL